MASGTANAGDDPTPVARIQWLDRWIYLYVGPGLEAQTPAIRQRMAAAVADGMAEQQLNGTLFSIGQATGSHPLPPITKPDHSDPLGQRVTIAFVKVAPQRGLIPNP